MVATQRHLQLFLLKADGLLRCRWDGQSERVEVLNAALDGETVREVARDPFSPKRLYAATLTEIHVSEDDGASWQWLPSGGIDYRDIWTMAVHPTRASEIYVGTMPAAVYVSENGGRSFRELSAFRSLPDYNKWTFPPGPHVAHIRCITLDARVPDEISGPGSTTAFPKINDPAGIVPYEMGKHEEGRVYRDVHWVMRHPTRLETLFASTGIGTYQTHDGGKNWLKCEYGMGRAYAIPMTNHASVPDRIFLGAAKNGPASWPGYRTVRAGPYNTVKFSRNVSAQTGGARTQLLRSDDAGKTWKRLETGVPAGYQHMTCGFAARPEDANTLCVGYTDGSVYATHDGGDHWHQLDLPESKLYGVRLMAVP